MLLFNRAKKVKRLYIAIISIHHVLLFNLYICVLIKNEMRFQYTMCCCSTFLKIIIPWTCFYVSIHHVLLFNIGVTVNTRVVQVFQYTMCCCSTGLNLAAPIRRLLFQYTMCCCSTWCFEIIFCLFFTVSIHHVLLFNLWEQYQSWFSQTSFQYTMCCCSTLNNVNTNTIRGCGFNTPCVVVQH